METRDRAPLFVLTQNSCLSFQGEVKPACFDASLLLSKGKLNPIRRAEFWEIVLTRKHVLRKEVNVSFLVCCGQKAVWQQLLLLQQQHRKVEWLALSCLLEHPDLGEPSADCVYMQEGPGRPQQQQEQARSAVLVEAEQLTRSSRQQQHRMHAPRLLRA